MKTLIVCIAMLLIPMLAGAYGIVNNSGTTSEDSVCFIILNPDSLGQPLGGLDTTRVLVLGPQGDSIFSEVVAGVTGRVGRRSQGAGKYDTIYYYKALVADIDGGGAAGTYSIRLMAVSNESGAYLRFTKTYEFQVTARDLSDALFAISNDSLTGGGLSATQMDSVIMAALSAFTTDSCANMDTVVYYAAERVLDQFKIRDSAGTLLRDSTFTNGLKKWIKDHGGVATITSTDIANIAKASSDSTLKKKMTLAYTSTDSTLVNWFWRANSPDSIATPADIAVGLLDHDTTGHGAANTVGKAIQTGGVGGGLDIAALSNWADTAKILKYYMPSTQLVFGGFHVEGTAADTFPGAFSVRHAGTQDKPGMYSRGGGGGSAGHGIFSTGGTSGGFGGYYFATLGDGMRIVGGGNANGLGLYSGTSNDIAVGKGALALIAAGNYHSALYGEASANYNVVHLVASLLGDGIHVESATGDAVQFIGGRDFVLGASGTGYISGKLATVDTLTYGFLSDTNKAGQRYALMPEAWNADDSTAYGGGAVAAISSFTGTALAKIDSIPKNGKAWTPSSITTSFIGNITGNLSGSVNSVTALGTVNSNIISFSASGDATTQNMRLLFDGSNSTLGSISFSQMYGYNATAPAMFLSTGASAFGAFYASNLSGPGMNASGSTYGFYATGGADSVGFKGIMDSVKSIGTSSGGMSFAEFSDYVTENPDLFGCVSNTSGFGSAKILNITVVDTSAAPDDSLQSVVVTVLNQTNNTISLAKTGSGGVGYATLDTGTYTLRSFERGYTFDTAVVHVTADQSVVFRGRNTFQSNRCYVWGKLTNGPYGSGVGLAVVTLTMPENAKNTCDSSIIVGRTVSCVTNSDGTYQFPSPIVWSSCMNNVAYDLEIKYIGTTQPRKYKITVPNATTYQVVL